MTGMDGGSAKTCGALKRGVGGLVCAIRGFAASKQEHVQDWTEFFVITLILGAKRLKIS